MEINKLKGIAERKLDHMRHGCFRGSLNHFIETGIINGSFLEAINSLITECEGKSDSTSEKDLRVCEVNGWLSCSESLPEAKQYKSGIIPNEDLVIIKWDKHDSYEFAVLKQSQFGLIWDIPDHGFAEISEVSKWKRF